MNADRLLALYEKVAEAPDAVPRLRRFVLDLAVRGKLVPQDAGDEPASELLKRIAAEKVRLVKAGEIKKPRPLERVENSPFELPSLWEWVRLGALGTTQTGSTPPKSKPEHYGSDVPFIRPGDLYPDRVDYSGDGLSQLGVEASGRLAPSGSVLMVCIGTVGKCQIVDRSVSFNQQINTITAFSLLEPRYLLLAMQSDFFRTAAWAASARTTIAILNKGNWEKLPIPLPPLAEQRRIVAKVEELMALLDRLEAARTAREATRDRLTAASLARLTAPDAEASSGKVGTGFPSDDATNKKTADFPANARLALATLPALTTRRDQIKALRQTILNLAVRGKLVAQDASDEPASILLDRARNAKKLLREQRRIGRSEDPEYSNSPGEKDAPKHWAWGHLADFALVLGGKRLPAGASFTKEPTQHIYIRVTDMKGGTISDEGLKFISAEVQKKIAKYTIDKEDIFITIAGTIGEVGIVPAKFDGQNLTENAAKIVFREIDRDFLVLALRSDDIQHQFTEKTKQMAQPKLALKRILGARVPLPPLAEQHRIVAKVDALMALCDRLEAALTTADTTRAHLLEALLHEALDPDADTVTEAAE